MRGLIMLNVGDKLRNGATVLQVRETGVENESVVLAFWNNEFVTWVVTNDWHSFWGNYYGQNLEKALADFNSRLNSA